MGKHKATGTADVTICSVATLVASGGRRMLKFDPGRIKLILMDECHHAVAKSWLTVLEYFGALRRTKKVEDVEALDEIAGVEEGKDLRETELEETTEPDFDGPIVAGVSATMSRFDGLGLGKVLDRIVFHKDYVDMVTDKW